MATLFCAAPAAAEGLPEGLAAAERVQALRALDVDVVLLADGRPVRLAGIQGPRPPPGREPTRPWPIADNATAALDSIVAGQALVLAYDGPRSDRYGRIVAHAAAGPLWVEGEMLKRGLARVETTPQARAGAREMLALEAAARAQRLGLWRLDAYDVLNAARARRFIDTFQLVEDLAQWARGAAGRNELRLGRDVVVTFTAAARRELQAGGLDPRTLGGHTLRVRGWLASRNGAALEVSHREQLEIVE